MRNRLSHPGTPANRFLNLRITAHKIPTPHHCIVTPTSSIRARQANLASSLPPPVTVQVLLCERPTVFHLLSDSAAPKGMWQKRGQARRRNAAWLKYEIHPPRTRPGQLVHPCSSFSKTKPENPFPNGNYSTRVNRAWGCRSLTEGSTWTRRRGDKCDDEAR